MEVQSASHTKKHDMENYVKEEAANPKGDEVKAKENKDLVKTKMSVFVSIITCIILEDSQGYVRCNEHLIRR